MVELGTLQGYVNSYDEDVEYLTSCLGEARGLVSDFIGTAVVPEPVLDRAVLETAAALFGRKGGQGGLAGFNGDGTPVFHAKDPLNSVYPMLRRYVMPF